MNRGLVLASAFWIVVVAMVLGAAAALVWNRHQAVQAQLSTIEPRYARILGLGAERARMETLAKQSGEALARHVYPASGDGTQAGNQAQQRARALFAQSGLEVQSIQVLPARTVGRFDRIPISLRAEGELLPLQTALAAMPSLAPTLFVEAVNIQVQQVRPGGEPRLGMQFDLFVLRARE
jgi:general secretion pathway protein M